MIVNLSAPSIHSLNPVATSQVLSDSCGLGAFGMQSGSTQVVTLPEGPVIATRSYVWQVDVTLSNGDAASCTATFDMAPQPTDFPGGTSPLSAVAPVQLYLSSVLFLCP